MLRRQTAIATAIFSLSTSLALSQSDGEQTESHALSDYVVVATTRSRQVFDAPYAAYALPDDNLKLDLGTRTFAERLEHIPGVMLQKTGHGMTAPYLRGLTGQRTVLMADGVRVNTSVLREGPNQYWSLLNPFFYDRADVLMGPASVLYGSDAIGGVVAARSTPIPRGTADTALKMQDGRALFRYSTAEQSYTEYIESAFTLSDRIGLRLGVTRQDFGELNTGEDTENPMTNYEQWGLNLRARYWISDRHSIVAGYDHFDQDDIDRVHKTKHYVPWHGTTKGGDDRRVYDHDRRAAFLRYEVRNGSGWLEQMDVGVSYQYLLENYYADRRTNKGREEYRTTRVETLGLNLRLQSPSPFGTWTYGADYWHDFVSSYGENIAGGVVTPRLQGQVGDDADYALAGIYLQNELPIARRWELITGVRYTYADLEAKKVNIPGVGLQSLSGNWDAVTGSVRLLWHPLPEQLNIFAGVSQGFRAPNLSDATRDDEFGGGTEKPTTDLDEERFTTFELGFKQRWQRGHLQAVGYYTHIEDRIARFAAPTNTKRNIDEGYIQGIEAAAEIDLTSAWTLFGSAAWQEGYEDTFANRDITQPIVERPMSRIAPLYGELGLRWTAPTEKLWLEFLVEAASEQDKLAPTEKSDNRFPPGGTPGYAVYTIQGGWSITEHLTLGAALDNITDKDYRIHGSGINEPGRNMIVTLSADF